MGFRNYFSRSILIPAFLISIIVGVVLWKSLSKSESSTIENLATEIPVESIKDTSLKPLDQDLKPDLDPSKDEDVAIQKQLDLDRQEQKQTKYLKTKLEQTNLELEQEKALAEINKLKMENVGAFNDPGMEGQKNIPDVKVEYIGGDNSKKEAILSIAGINYQVKEKSSPTDNIQIMSISDSGVTLHFSAPQELTKTIEYKPE